MCDRNALCFSLLLFCLFLGGIQQAFFLVESSYRYVKTESVDITVPPSRLGAR